MSTPDEDPHQIAKRNIAVFQRWFDAANAQDYDALIEVYHPDIVKELPWTIDPFPKAVHGHENVMAFSRSVREFLRTPNFYDIEIRAFLDDPYELYAEYKSDMDLVSGREYKNDYIARVRVQDGRLISYKEWPDPIRLLKSMGGSINLPEDFQARIVHGAGS